MKGYCFPNKMEDGRQNLERCGYICTVRFGYISFYTSGWVICYAKSSTPHHEIYRSIQLRFKVKLIYRKQLSAASISNSVLTYFVVQARGAINTWHEMYGIYYVRYMSLL